MKRFTSIAILVLLLFHILGFYVYFVVRLGQIRQEMRVSIALMPKAEMEIFRLTPEEYRRARINNHEVEINGKMYDHAPPQVEANRITLYAIHDQSEDNLLSFFREVVRTASKDSKPIPSTINSYLSLVFLSSPVIELTTKSNVEKMDIPYNTKLLAPSLPVEPMPPWS